MVEFLTPQRLYRLSEVRMILCISRNTLEKIIKNGLLETITLRTSNHNPSQRRVTGESLQEYISKPRPCE